MPLKATEIVDKNTKITVYVGGGTVLPWAAKWLLAALDKHQMATELAGNNLFSHELASQGTRD